MSNLSQASEEGHLIQPLLVKAGSEGLSFILEPSHEWCPIHSNDHPGSPSHLTLHTIGVPSTPTITLALLHS
ncbi:hypothetical protein J6590_053473 [Homalodisca vitripennis]|nr:hypothetical protein J6590_053473 [Homalodisca vitripennis]